MNTAPLLNCASLRELGRELPNRFSIPLADGTLNFHEVLRLLPGKRASGVAEWNGRPVFAKLYFAEGAPRHAQRELEGLRYLSQTVPTPECVYSGTTRDGMGCVVMTQLLSDATTLSAASSEASLLEAIAMLGRLHRAGYVHTDGHFGNFLQGPSGLFLVDGDGVSPAATTLAHIENLALFCSQLDSTWDVNVRRVMQAYGSPLQATDFVASVERARQRRLTQYLHKSLRDCTEFSVTHTSSRFAVHVRSASARLRLFLADPDALMVQGSLLKDGGTATVACVALEEKKLLIKRYNIKGPTHWLSRFWRPSRAWRSWQAGLTLRFYGIATPAPLAMIESRFGPLRGQAWLATEYVEGESLLARSPAGALLPQAEGESLLLLLQSLHRNRISHGDLKATNILLSAEAAQLIDLDSMKCHSSDSAFKRAWKKDKQRLLRNWPVDSAIVAWLSSQLP